MVAFFSFALEIGRIEGKDEELEHMYLSYIIRANLQYHSSTSGCTFIKSGIHMPMSAPIYVGSQI